MYLHKVFLHFFYFIGAFDFPPLSPANIKVKLEFLIFRNLVLGSHEQYTKYNNFKMRFCCLSIVCIETSSSADSEAELKTIYKSLPPKSYYANMSKLVLIGADIGFWFANKCRLLFFKQRPNEFFAVFRYEGTYSISSPNYG